MTTHLKKWILFSALVAAAGASFVAHAGVQYNSEVVITYDAAGAVNGATGSLFSAHDSSDSNQLIGCGGSSPPMWCQAHDARPNAPGVLNQAFCTTSNPEMIAQIRSLAPMSYINFRLNPATGECTSIYVANNSANLRH